ncbi:bifunctional DNA-formamidopyrimidine glycosylase/DNA-(apurinic or apyrimidinic site) lyase [Actinokineospora sp. HUAS TT18]|uniref:bifunctional DNA-formamidopyrimidine glycosylase/DNA-(apurinic or apyrimidinic site) lyase n=1 Tax=Actinokineospora sp. HUAS TT18 TaxID=3447451 RepID=UPI003F523BCF
MPELPEVEVVRRGLEAHVLDRQITSVDVHHPRAIRRHIPGATDFAARIVGTHFTAAQRRGKYLWLELSSGAAVLAHLGMSGQMLVQPAAAAPEKHLRVRIAFTGDPELRFVDQRTFGGLSVEDVVTVDGTVLPVPVAHIARDPMDPKFDLTAAVTALRAKRTEVKRALLDQTVVSGIGNIYADEALWRVKLHWSRATDTLSAAKARALIEAATEVMSEALHVGGTSFDALYVNVNGQSGYFDRSLAAYGQEGLPCPRCGRPIRREPFMNRSSFSCPRCQRT